MSTTTIPNLHEQKIFHDNYSQSFSKKINHTIYKFLQLQNTQSSTLRKFLLQIISSLDTQDWLIIKSLLQSPIASQNPKLNQILLHTIQDIMFENQQTYVMRVYLYGLMRDNNIRFTYGRTQKQLKMFVEQGKLSIFNSWLLETVQSKQSVQTLKMLCQYYPLVIQQQRLLIELPELQFILHIISHIQLNFPHVQLYIPQVKLSKDSNINLFQQVDKLLSSIKTYRICLLNNRVNNNYLKNNSFSHQTQHSINQQLKIIQQQSSILNNEQHQIINLTLDILAHSKSTSGNCIWIFSKKIFKQTDLRSFVTLHTQLILKYSQVQLVNIFKKIFSYGLQQNTFALFRQLSYTLKQTQKFYQLKILYQQILLPIIVYKAKTKLNLQHQIFQLASFYIIGFYQHCDIGKNGLQCILTNINKLSSIKSIKQQWIELALLTAQKNIQRYKKIVYQSLRKQGIQQQQIKIIDQLKGFDHFKQSQIWQITIRNSKKHKSYIKTQSKLYKGIQNNYLQCYIISVIQALYTTLELPRVIQEFYSVKFDMLSYHIRQLFKNLKTVDYKGRTTVDYVKKYSPQQFSYQDKQQDAQQYLSKVLQKIQQQLKVNDQKLLLQQFYKTFRFKINRKLQCQNCQNIIDKSQQLFIHTIPNKTSLRQNYVQQIEGYKCQKCTKSKFLNKTTIQPSSKILIIHINRFSYTNGKSRKQLATQQIKRNFLDYKLKGIIFHIGKIIQCGHYVYYFNQAGKKWLQMNDQQVNQFQLQNQNEEFQRQMKSQMTPYILIYVRK